MRCIRGIDDRSMTSVTHVHNARGTTLAEDSNSLSEKGSPSRLFRLGSPSSFLSAYNPNGWQTIALDGIGSPDDGHGLPIILRKPAAILYP